ncbi:hypothetical protein MHH81_20765 [Psychrobacillus sp. FSL H8-0484]|uniref:hypothetical protein n=1 Tax=Psychrobacillus sp. FSL H8-0484 TaxID=2921390 RepID=UPI0030F4E623
MKWSFNYLGDKDNRQYFCITTDDGTERGQGISVRFHYYSRQLDGSLKSLNYMEIPIFGHKPSKEEAKKLMDIITRFFHGWLPYNMIISN